MDIITNFRWHMGINRKDLPLVTHYIDTVVGLARKDKYNLSMLRNSASIFLLTRSQLSLMLTVATEFGALPFENSVGSRYPNTGITLRSRYTPALALLICCGYNDLLVAKQRPPEEMTMEDISSSAQSVFGAIRSNLEDLPDLSSRFPDINSINQLTPPLNPERKILLSRKGFSFKPIDTSAETETIDEIRQRIITDSRKNPSLNRKIGGRLQ